MFLTAYNLPHYLLSKGLIDSQSLVAGDFAIAEAGRRNRNPPGGIKRAGRCEAADEISAEVKYVYIT